MAIKASGSSLSFSEIATFWGGSQPHSLSEYYANGSNVFSGAEDEAGNDIPSSGALKFSDFYSTHTVTTGGTTNFTSSGTYTIPLGVSTLIITLYGGGGQGGEGDESGSGGGGGGGGSGAVIQGTLTVSNNIQGNPTAQTIAVTVGSGGYVTFAKASGGESSIVYGGQTTVADGGGHGGGFTQAGSNYGVGASGSSSLGSNFSGTIYAPSTGDGAQGGSGDGFSAAGTAGKAVSNDILGIGSTGGAGGAINPSSDSVQTGKAASGFGAGGGGAASRDRSGAHHWYGGSGSGGYVRIVVAS